MSSIFRISGANHIENHMLQSLRLDQAICQAIENRGDFGAKGRQTSNGLLIQERIPLE